MRARWAWLGVGVVCCGCGAANPLAPAPAGPVAWVGQPLPAGCFVEFLPPSAPYRAIVRCPPGTPGF